MSTMRSRSPHPRFGYPYSEIMMDGKKYVGFSTFDIEFGGGYTEIRTNPKSLESINKCDHCGRSDIREKVAHSWEQAIEFGWLLPEEQFETLWKGNKL